MTCFSFLRLQRSEILSLLLTPASSEARKRLPSQSNPDLATSIREEVGLSLRQHKGDWPCYFFTQLTTFSLPAGKCAGAVLLTARKPANWHAKVSPYFRSLCGKDKARLWLSSGCTPNSSHCPNPPVLHRALCRFSMYCGRENGERLTKNKIENVL